MISWSGAKVGESIQRAPGTRCDVFSHDSRLLADYMPCKPGIVYVVKGDGDLIKIGFSDGVSDRVAWMGRITRQYKMQFTHLFSLEAHCARGLEMDIHRQIHRFKVDHPCGREMFRLSDQDLSKLSNIAEYCGRPVTLQILTWACNRT